MKSQLAIDINNLSRDYGSKNNTYTALKNINLNVQQGEIFGLIGENGAGKTTMIKILTTLLLPTSGKVKVLGYDVYKEENKIRKNINFVYGGERNLYWRLTGRENLIYFGNLYKVKDLNNRINSIIDKLTIGDYIDNKVQTYSKGMKQKLQIAKGLLNHPKILFLDEPTIGLDPSAAKELRIIIKELSKRGVTVFLTTHYLDEAEKLCDRIAFLKKGEIIALDYVNNLLEKYAGYKITNITTKTMINQSQVDNLKEYKFMFVNNDCTKFSINHKVELDVFATISDIIDTSNIVNMNTSMASLEDVYFTLMGDRI